MSDYISDLERDNAMARAIRLVLDARIASERKRLAADIRAALAKHEKWTSGPDALEHLAKELEK